MSSVEAELNQSVAYTPLQRMRHSAAHVMAEAVQELFPGARFAIGPAIEDGFYYDMELPRPLTPEDLPAIEERMRASIAANHPFVQQRAGRARRRWSTSASTTSRTRWRLIEDLPDDEVGIYEQGPFLDLCRGPHVESTGEIGPFKLMRVAGAYWRGDEKRPMLQRIYGTAWATQADLDAYLERLEEAQAARPPQARPRAGTVHDQRARSAPGCRSGCRKGATVRRAAGGATSLDVRAAGGLPARLHAGPGQARPVQDVGPLGALPGRHVPADGDGERRGAGAAADELPAPHPDLQAEAALSYRDLPIRIAELGTMYRYERSGELAGLSRVRAHDAQRRAHLLHARTRSRRRSAGVVRLIKEVYARPRHQRVPVPAVAARPGRQGEVRRQRRDVGAGRGARCARRWTSSGCRTARRRRGGVLRPEDRRAGARTCWARTRRSRPSRSTSRCRSGSSWSTSARTASAHRPVMIHRGVICTMERIMAFLIENYAGAFPLWLAPVQAVRDPDRRPAHRVRRAGGGRGCARRACAWRWTRARERMNAKIRDAAAAEGAVHAGGRRQRGGVADAVSVRLRTNENIGAVPLAEFVAVAKRLNDERDQELWPTSVAAQ